MSMNIKFVSDANYVSFAGSSARCILTDPGFDLIWNLTSKLIQSG